MKDTFSDYLSAKMYRSGDMVRFNAQGDIEFLGRLDSQVKVGDSGSNTFEYRNRRLFVRVFPPRRSSQGVAHSGEKSLWCFY